VCDKFSSFDQPYGRSDRPNHVGEVAAVATEGGKIEIIMDVLIYIISFIAGVILGLFYFGSLWFTLLYLSKTQRQVLVTVGSFFIRLAVTLFGFYLVMGGHWERLLIALGGFILGRIFLTRRLRARGRTPLTK
jgi:F1F0 ATPase subunit 2